MAAQAVPVFVSIRAKDFASGTFKRMTRLVKSSTMKMSAAARASLRTMGSAVKRLRGQFTLLRSVIVGLIGRKIIDTFARFEKGMGAVATLTDDAASSFQVFSVAAEKAMLLTGSSVDDTSKALFDLVSAQVASATSTDVLTAAGKLAVAGASTMTAATRGLIAIIKSYGLEASDATRVSDALFQAQKLGITTVERLSINIGKLSPIARQAGISFEEMLSSVAALTAVTGLTTEEAVTALRQAIVAAIRPTKDSVDAAKALGLEWTASTLAAKGFLGLVQQLGKKGMQPTVEQMQALGGTVRGFVGLAGLATDGAKAFKITLDSMAHAAGVTETNFLFMSKTLSVQLDRLKAAFATVSVELGKGMKPVLEDIINGLHELASWIRRNDNLIVGFFTRLVHTVAIVARLLATKLSELFTFLKTSMEEGTFVKDILTVVRNMIVAIAKIFVDSLPLLVKAATLIGRQVGAALIQAVIGGTKARTARRVAAGDGFLEWMLGLSMTDAEIDKLKEAGKELNRIEKTLVGTKDRGVSGRDFAAELKTVNEEIDKLKHTLSLSVWEGGLIGLPFRQAQEDLLKLQNLASGLWWADATGFRDFRFDPLHIDEAKLKEDRERIIRSLGGIGAAVLKSDTRELDSAIGEFTTAVSGHLREMVDNIVVEMSPKVSAVAAKLFRVQDFTDAFKAIEEEWATWWGEGKLMDSVENFADDFKAKQPELISAAKAGFGGMTDAASGFLNMLKTAKAGVSGLLGAFATGVPGTAPGAAPDPTMRPDFAGEAIRRAQREALGVGEFAPLSTPEEQLTFAQKTGQNIANAMDLVTVGADGQQRLKDIGEVYGDAFTTGVLSIIGAFQSTLSDTFYSLFTGDLEGIKDAFDDFFKSIVRAMADFVAEMFAKWLVLKALGLLGQLFGIADPAATVTPGGFDPGSPNLPGLDPSVFDPSFTPTAVAAKGAVWPGGFKAFQRGGIANRATLGLVGEGRNAEAIVPLPDNRSIPVKLQGSAGQNVVVNVNFDVTAMDAQSVSAMIVAESKTIAGVVKRALNQDINFKQGVSARVGRR